MITDNGRIVAMKQPIHRAHEYKALQHHVRAKYLDGGWLSVVGDNVQRVQSRKLAWQGSPTQFIALCKKYGLTQHSFRVYRVADEDPRITHRKYAK